MGITFGDHLIDSGYFDITPEQEREIESREEWVRYADVEAALAAMPQPVAVRHLEWYPDPGAFPYNTWGAQSSFGRFIIEEVSASDSPAYEARYTPHHLITIKDSLEDAKAAAQADFEARILSALRRTLLSAQLQPHEPKSAVNEK